MSQTSSDAKTVMQYGTNLIVACFSVVLAGCGSKDLTRDNAAVLIAASSQFTPVQAAPLTSESFSDGSAQGLWNDASGLTQKGAVHFIEVTRSRLRPKESLTRRVTEVTGIADASSPLGGTPARLKEIQFRWELAGVGDVTRRFVQRGGTGFAIARLFDDGWRLEELRLQELDEGFVLSAAEKAAASRDREAETERRLAEQRLIAQARQVGAVILKCGPIQGYAYTTLNDSFSVTDVGVSGAYHANIAYSDVQYLNKIDPNITAFDKRPGIWLSDRPWNPNGNIGIRFTGAQAAANRDACYDAIVQSYGQWRGRFPTLAKLPSLK